MDSGPPPIRPRRAAEGKHVNVGGRVHLTPRRIRQLAEGRVNRKEHEEDFAHIAICADCRRTFIAAGDRAEPAEVRFPELTFFVEEPGGPTRPVEASVSRESKYCESYRLAAPPSGLGLSIGAWSPRDSVAELLGPGPPVGWKSLASPIHLDGKESGRSAPLSAGLRPGAVIIVVFTEKPIPAPLIREAVRSNPRDGLPTPEALIGRLGSILFLVGQVWLEAPIVTLS